jgi:hypothetical protein
MADELKTAAPLTSRQTEQFRDKINNIVGSGRAASMELCWAAYESDVNMTRVNGELVFCWSTWGYDSWEDFVGKELDLHVTTAYAYKRIWEVFYVDLAGCWDTGMLLGITKMRHLTSAPLTKSNVNTWLKRAKKLTCRELVAQIYDRDDTHSFAVPLTSSQLKLVHRAIEQGKTSFTRGEKMSRGQVLTAIMREWAELKGAAAPKPRLKAVA